MAGLLWPARRYVVTRNPQGDLAAPLGAYAVNVDTGAIYRKRAGGSTQWGWYLDDPGNDQSLAWVPRFASGATRHEPIGLVTVLASNPSTPITGPAFSSIGVVKRSGPWTGGFTSNGLNNIWIVNPSAVLTGWPVDQIAADGAPVSALSPWDAVFEVLTTPRASSGGTATTLADIRLWAGVCFQNTTIQLSGGTGNTNVVYTEFPSCMTINAGSYAAMFRFASAIDAGWVLVTANDNGAAASQTVTAMGPIAADTIYRLRLRFALVGAVPQIRASINDGPETTVTVNVGPGSVPGGAGQRKPIVPYISCRNLNGGGLLKSLCVGRIAIAYGAGLEF